MVLIIDGYNLLFEPSWIPLGNNLEEQRKYLIQKILQYRNLKKYRKIFLVFDGQYAIQAHMHYRPENNMYHDVKIIYALDEGRADEKIIDLARKRRGSVVVSADHKIIQKVKAGKGKILPPHEFIRELLQLNNIEETPTRPNYSCSDKEIENWLQTFHLEAEIELPETMYLASNKKLMERKLR